MTRIVALLVFIVLISGCATTGKFFAKPPPADKSKIDRLIEKRDLYRDFMLAGLDDNGWHQEDQCDGLTFQALLATAEPDVGTPLLAERSPGEFFRSPTFDCYPDHSRSTISRDGFLMLFHWILKNNRRDVIDRIITYGEAHSKGPVWIMGKGQLGAIEFRPNFIATAFELRNKLGGAYTVKQEIPQGFSTSANGYQRHLTVQHIYLRGKLRGMTESELDIVKFAADKNPGNSVYNGIYGIYANDPSYFDRAFDTLLDPQYYPADRLPTPDDRDSYYLFQREQFEDDGTINDDWLPGKGDRPFSAIGFFWACEIILGSLEE